MKFYDKDIHKKAEAIKISMLTLLIFIVGFITGTFAVNAELQKSNNEKMQHIVELERMLEEKQVKINEQFVEIDSLKETVYMLEMYGK